MAGFHFGYFEERFADQGMNGVWTSSISRFQWPNSEGLSSDMGQLEFKTRYRNDGKIISFG